MKKFIELTEDEFRDFSLSHKLTSFLQTPEIAHYKKMTGFNTYYVGVKENEKTLCATLLIEYKGRFFKSFSSPRGYLIDFRDAQLLGFFTKEIKKFIRNKGGIVLNIEPKLLYKQKDANGKLVQDGFDNSDIYNSLIKLGYKHNGFYLELKPTKQCRFAYAIDLKNKTKDEIFKEFSSTTKNSIHKALKYGIRTRRLNYEELNEFKTLVDDSANVKGFFRHELDYYQKMYNLFNPLNQITFLVADLYINDYISVLNEEIGKHEEKIKKIGDSSSPKYKEFAFQIDSLKEKIEKLKKQVPKNCDKLPIAGGMFIEYGNETIYAFSGMLSEYKNIPAQYLIQWEMIEKSIDRNCALYNFYGITGDLRKSNPQYGVYEFKKGFGGSVIEYMGDFDLVVSPLKYYLLRCIKKMCGEENE